MSFLKHHRTQRFDLGFTLIEAIVAMAIIGVAVLPIMLLISESLNQLTRAADATARAAAMDSVISTIDPVNPFTTPSGEIDMGSFSFTWESTTIVAPNETVQTGAGLAGHKVGFYDVHIETFRQQQPWFSFSARKVGYEKLNGANPLVGSDE